MAYNFLVDRLLGRESHMLNLIKPNCINLVYVFKFVMVN